VRGDQLSRQWRVLRQIEVSKNGLLATEIAELGGVSLRTAYRDLDDLQLAGFPLYGEKEEKGQRWKFVDSYRFKVPQPFTFTELMSLHLSKDLFKVFEGTIFGESMESLFDKVRAALPPQTLGYLDRVQSVFHMGLKPYKDYGRFKEIINQVNQAALDRRCIEIAYHALNVETEAIRKVNPYKIWFYDGTIYLIGLCHLRNEVRTFVLDRIRILRLTDEQFEIPADFDFEKYVRYSFKVMQDELYTVKILISPSWSRYIGEKIWHESQTIQKLFDGSIQIVFKVAGLDEISQWVMSLGPEAYVLGPESLQDLVKAGLRDALDQYETTGALFQKQRLQEGRSDYAG